MGGATGVIRWRAAASVQYESPDAARGVAVARTHAARAQVRHHARRRGAPPLHRRQQPAEHSALAQAGLGASVRRCVGVARGARQAAGGECTDQATLAQQAAGAGRDGGEAGGAAAHVGPAALERGRQVLDEVAR